MNILSTLKSPTNHQVEMKLVNLANRIDQKITAHIHIITERSVWKVFEFEPTVTVDDAIKQIARKVSILSDHFHL